MYTLIDALFNRHKTIVFLFFLSGFAFPALCQSLVVDSSNLIILRIDPDNARGASVSDIFEEVDFIPLETTKESLFGKIRDLAIFKGHFVIYDFDTRAVLVFSAAGKFKAKIQGRMLAKNSKERDIYGFTILPYQKDSVIAVRLDQRMYYLNVNGERIAEVPLTDKSYGNEFRLHGTETKVLHDYAKSKKDSINYEFALVTKRDTVPYIPYNAAMREKDDFLDDAKFFNYGIPGEVFFNKPHCFDLYKLNPAKLTLAYRLVFSAVHSLPSDFITNPKFVNKRSAFLRDNQKMFHSINFVYQIGDNLYLQMNRYPGGGPDLKQSIIYNLKTHKIISLQDLAPDKLSYFLPVNDAGHSYNFINKGLLFNDGYFYTNYSSLTMFSFKEQLGDRKKQFGTLLDEYFKTQDRKSNPVMVRLKPKRIIK